MSKLIAPLVLLLALMLPASAQLAPYEITEFVNGLATRNNTNAVLTNTQVKTFGVRVPPGQDVGVTAAYNGSNLVSGPVTFWLKSSYDTNYANLWQTNLTFTLAANGTNIAAHGTNVSFGDRGYSEVTVSNGIGSTLSNLTIKLHNLNP